LGHSIPFGKAGCLRKAAAVVKRVSLHPAHGLKALKRPPPLKLRRDSLRAVRHWLAQPKLAPAAC